MAPEATGGMGNTQESSKWKKSLSDGFPGPGGREEAITTETAEDKEVTLLRFKHQKMLDCRQGGFQQPQALHEEPEV